MMAESIDRIELLKQGHYVIFVHGSEQFYGEVEDFRGVASTFEYKIRRPINDEIYWILEDSILRVFNPLDLQKLVDL